jgi:hypothetical protein
MGVSTDGIFAYGFNLGGDEGGWKVEGAGEWGNWEPTWYDPDGEDSLTEVIERRLLASVGFTETDWQAEGYFKRKKDAEAKLGVSLVRHCSSEYTMYILAACEITASRGDVKTVDFSVLDQQRQGEDWDAKLRQALNALGIVPSQAEPAWLLVSYWG